MPCPLSRLFPSPAPLLPCFSFGCRCSCEPRKAVGSAFCRTWLAHLTGLPFSGLRGAVVRLQRLVIRMLPIRRLVAANPQMLRVDPLCGARAQVDACCGRMARRASFVFLFDPAKAGRDRPVCITGLPLSSPRSGSVAAAGYAVILAPDLALPGFSFLPHTQGFDDAHTGFSHA